MARVVEPSSGPPPDDVVDQILAQAPDNYTAEAMLLGSSLEGGWGPTFAVGDHGTSFGPFQMHEGGALTSSGLTPGQASDPAQAVKAMLPAYEAGVQAQGTGLWNTNPEQAAEQAAVMAEKPGNASGIVPYFVSPGVATVNAKWNNVLAAIGGGQYAQPGSAAYNAAVATGANATGQSGTLSAYQPANSAIGKVLQQIDGFLNPSVSAVPGWINTFTGANSTASALATIGARGLGVFVGLVITGIGVVVLSGGSVGGVLKQSGPLGFALEVAKHNQRGQVAQTRANVQTMAIGQRHAASQTDAATKATELQARERREREAREERAHRLQVETELENKRIKIAEDAERRRQQEADRKAGR